MPVIVSLALLSAAVALQLINVEAGKQLTAEGGPIVTFSAAIWGIGLAVALTALARKRSAVWLAGAVMLGWACLRELDLQTAFTYRSIESLGYYTRPIASLSEKLLVLAAMLPFAIAGSYLVWRVWRDFRNQRFGESVYGGYVMVGVILLTVGMSCEKLLSLTIVEEVAELGLAFDMLLLTTTRLQALPEGSPSKAEVATPAASQHKSTVEITREIPG